MPSLPPSSLTDISAVENPLLSPSFEAAESKPDGDDRATFWKQFSKSQVSSFAATLLDYGTLFGLAELAHVYYVVAVACGALVGAASNFVLNRYWSFDATHRPVGHQAFRYALVSAGSLALNTGGVYLVTELCHIRYGYSVVAVSLLVGFLFNFPLQRGYVFR